MKTIRYNSKGSEVETLEQALKDLGYDLTPNTYFGKVTHDAVRDFQRNHQLVVDGIVGPKTWSKIQAAKDALQDDYREKLLSEQDLIDFASVFNLELPVVKAVNEVESRGEGFLNDGRPKILFEGHIFWRQLKNRGLNTRDFLNDYTKNVLYEKWTKSHYAGGSDEYHRLEKAAGMSDLQEVHDAAYASASWGCFQIMGYHYSSLGYSSVDAFVASMYQKEAKHLLAFGRYLEANNLVNALKNKDWHKFARGYNGPGYLDNNYHIKLDNAYQRYV